ncbi:MAG: hypothetical protein ABEI54_05150 [Candidatus Bipolaricaulia bacterium]
MTQKVRQESKSIGEACKNTISPGNRFCPRCGGEMVTTGQGVAASFPSPALERLVCSDSSCNYVKYVKLDSNGFLPGGSSAASKGDQSAQ